MFNYNPLANSDNGSCIPFIYGCLDSTMFNYNPLANTNNNSCIAYVYGCTDPSMLNYNFQANTEDFSCIAYIYGCMDSLALNYDSTANTENNSCIDIVIGCTDPDAYNYNAFANVPAFYTCLFDANCYGDPGVPYFLNDECYAWVIEVDEYCCTNQWDTICQLTYDYCYGTYTGPLVSRAQADRYIIGITDLLGRPSKEEKNKLLLYIYNDGSVVRKILINK